MEKKVSEKVLSMLKKVYELAKRGVDGEKENAESLLLSLLQKYQLTLEDLEIDEYYKLEFGYYQDRFWKSYQTIIHQCFLRYGDKDLKIYIRDLNNGKKIIYGKVTKQQSILIREAVLHYWKIFQKSVDEEYVVAFVLKNELVCQEEDDEDEKRDKFQKQMTPEERAKWYRIHGMKEGIEKSSLPQKKLQQNN